MKDNWIPEFQRMVDEAHRAFYAARHMPVPYVPKDVPIFTMDDIDRFLAAGKDVDEMFIARITNKQ